jgi:hypothetical protein
MEGNITFQQTAQSPEGFVDELVEVEAPKARNVIAWGKAPGQIKPLETLALKALHWSDLELENARSHFAPSALWAPLGNFFPGRCPRLLHSAPTALQKTNKNLECWIFGRA